MHKQLAIVRKYRAQLAELASTLNVDQLNKIPDGFNNNIIWHMGHLVVEVNDKSIIGCLINRCSNYSFYIK